MPRCCIMCGYTSSRRPRCHSQGEPRAHFWWFFQSNTVFSWILIQLNTESIMSFINTECLAHVSLNATERSGQLAQSENRWLSEYSYIRKLSYCSAIWRSPYPLIQQVGGWSWPVFLGRIDGAGSFADEVNGSLPERRDKFTKLVNTFAKVGLDAKDMIILSGSSGADWILLTSRER